MFSTIYSKLVTKYSPTTLPTMDEIYPNFVGQAQRNTERMQAIIKEMGAKHILHASHKAKRLKKARPV